MKLELIVLNKQDAIQAEKLGADRLELVSAIQEGGLTPSFGTMKSVIESVNIPVQVMIRPHSNHFFYKEEEFAVICEDIKALQSLQCNRIVFGALNEDRTINEQMLAKLIELFPNLNITFHRAFDEVVELDVAYEMLVKYKNNVKRILTSGGKANCEAGKEQLAKLVTNSQHLQGPVIMPGSGLTPDNIAEIAQTTKAEQYHFGKAVREGDTFANAISAQAVDKVLSVFKK
ncbi:copper homeostasis protein CutC [Virgibacillus pantothenticus]|uniref:copper homeostasis protein CutC n=1 Tax=Virgibacillus pantothenticus TaxID=1473 RepID=UPI000985B43E|nr:copper homeostasis protein CutC [Virgibacillus pantothenticus]